MKFFGKKSMFAVSLITFIGIFVVLKIGGVQGTPWVVWTNGFLEVATIAAFFRWFIVRQREGYERFERIFDRKLPSDVNEFAAKKAEIQIVVNQTLREKALAYYLARRMQEGHRPSGTLRKDRRSRILRANVRMTKRDFWEASNTARDRGFVVKWRHMDWLNDSPESVAQN